MNTEQPVVPEWEKEFEKLEITGIGAWHKSADYHTIKGFISRVRNATLEEAAEVLEIAKEQKEFDKRSIYYSQNTIRSLKS